jgi:hypothetical protein
VPQKREGWNIAARESVFYGKRLRPQKLTSTISHQDFGPIAPEGGTEVHVIEQVKRSGEFDKYRQEILGKLASSVSTRNVTFYGLKRHVLWAKGKGKYGDPYSRSVSRSMAAMGLIKCHVLWAKTSRFLG